MTPEPARRNQAVLDVERTQVRGEHTWQNQLDPTATGVADRVSGPSALGELSRCQDAPLPGDTRHRACRTVRSGRWRWSAVAVRAWLPRHASTVPRLHVERSAPVDRRWSMLANLTRGRAGW